MKKVREFSAFGKRYRCEQFSAMKGLELMGRPNNIHPCEMLSSTRVLTNIGAWADMSDDEILNDNVIDLAHVLPPRVVLDGILSLVHDFNFAFLASWKSVKVPLRFVDGANSVTSANVEPMASQLIQDDVATLQQLEEYYSLEDAFKMFDTLMVKGVNLALSQEAALKKK
jgi:hypothetical protein